MNISVGDIVKMKITNIVCGRVVKIEYIKDYNMHVVAFHSGHGYLKYKAPRYLKIIRKNKKYA